MPNESWAPDQVFQVDRYEFGGEELVAAFRDGKFRKKFQPNDFLVEAARPNKVWKNSVLSLVIGEAQRQRALHSNLS